MAYIIGNTTVIDDNAALGSISGNSLNLANNSNISAGGGLYTSYTSSAPSVAVPTISPSGAGAVVTCVGGGGGGGGAYNSAGNPGGWAGVAVDALDLSPGGNVAVTIGGAGNGGYYQPYGFSFHGNAGSPSSFAHPGKTISTFGGRAGNSPYNNGGGYNGPRGGIAANGAFNNYGYSPIMDSALNPHGRGGNAGGYRQVGQAGGAGVIRILGV